MLTGIINRRTAGRAPLQSEIKIKFFDDDEELVLATATNISAGGMQFAIPLNSILFNIGDKINFIFQLPDSEEIHVLSEVRYRELPKNTSIPEIHYGTKFLDISQNSWNSIIQYYTINDPALQQPSASSSKSGQSEKITTLQTSVVLEDGSTLTGEIEDISFGGARINIAQLIPVNSHVNLQFYHKDQMIPINGSCIWSAPDKNNPAKFFAGIFFAHLTPEEFEHLKLLINR